MRIDNYAVSYTHLRAHETRGNLVCRLLLEKKHKKTSRLVAKVSAASSKQQSLNYIASLIHNYQYAFLS